MNSWPQISRLWSRLKKINEQLELITMSTLYNAIMKKKIFLLTTISLVFFLSKISNAQTPDWLWATNPAGSGDDRARSVTVDASGNTYVTGSFNSPTLSFGSIVLTNTNSSNSYDVFLAKYDSDGNVLWARMATGNSTDDANSIAVDDSGNVYIGGMFNSPTLTFGSTVLTNTNTNNNSYDIFLAKYDTNGNAIWAKKAGGTLHDGANAVVIDTLGNVLIAGYSYGSNYFSFDNITLTGGLNTGHFFLAKYSNSGNAIWATSGGSTYTTSATSIAVDNSGNTFVTGYFKGYILEFDTVNFNNPNGSNLYEDIFVAKYNTDGNLLWVKIEGGAKADIAYGISTDNVGSAYITGSFDSPTLHFGSTTLTNSSGGNYNNIFITKYDASGNVVWANDAGGTNEDVPTAIAVDSSGNAYITGYFKSPSLNFGSTTLTNEGIKDIFLTKYNTVGNVSWAKSVGGTTEDISNSVALDMSGNIYIAGTFTFGDLDFGSVLLNYTGVYDIFLAKYGLPAAPTASSNGPLCAGSTLSLSASTIAGATYYWTGPNGFTSNQQNPTVSTNATTVMGGVYNVVATVNTITGPAGSTTVVINPLPASAVITQNSNVLTSSSISGNQWYNSTNQIVGANSQTYTVTSDDHYFVIVTINGCSSDTSNIIQIVGTRINDLENNSIFVFPNPVINELTIESNSSIKYKFEIVNVIGQIMHSSVLETKSIIDLSIYPSGIYTLKINTENATVLKKIVKQ